MWNIEKGPACALAGVPVTAVSIISCLSWSQHVWKVKGMVKTTPKPPILGKVPLGALACRAPSSEKTLLEAWQIDEIKLNQGPNLPASDSPIMCS